MLLQLCAVGRPVGWGLTAYSALYLYVERDRGDFDMDFLELLKFP